MPFHYLYYCLKGLPFHYLSLPFLDLFTAFPRPFHRLFTAVSRPFHCLSAASSLPFHCVSLTVHCLSAQVHQTAGSSLESMSIELTSQGAGTYWYLPPECFETGQVQHTALFRALAGGGGVVGVGVVVVCCCLLVLVLVVVMMMAAAAASVAVLVVVLVVRVVTSSSSGEQRSHPRSIDSPLGPELMQDPPLNQGVERWIDMGVLRGLVC